MAKLIASQRKLGLVRRKLVTDAGGALCCCTRPDLYQVFVDCCDGIPRFAVSQTALNAIRARCGPLATLGLIVRLDGARTCYRDQGITMLTKEQVIAAGYEAIENDRRLTCVETSSAYPPSRCYTQSCPYCTSECCLTGLYRKQCPILMPDSLPKNNVCCSYGRQATRTEKYSTRYEAIEFTSLFTGGDDPFCQPPNHCYSELFSQRQIRTSSGEQVVRFTQCDAVGTPARPRVECIRAQHYASEQSVRRRWAFNEPKETDTNCLQYEDIPTNLQEERSQACIGVTDDTAILAISTFPNRPLRIVNTNPDGSQCIEIIESGGYGEGSVCENLVDFRTVCYGTNAGFPVKTSITNFSMSVGCSQGSYSFHQVTDWRADDTFACPEPGSLIRREIISHTASYSIAINAREGCAPTVCDKYARNGTISGSNDGTTLPLRGALELL
jgi:hypothetical protein